MDTPTTWARTTVTWIWRCGALRRYGTGCSGRLLQTSRTIVSESKHTATPRSEEHTSELQSRLHLVCRLLLEKKKKTKAIHAGQEPDSATGAVTVTIYQTSTYAQEGLGKHIGCEYARPQNAKRIAIDRSLSAL